MSHYIERQSKRLSVKDKQRIQKRVQQHFKKLRRTAKSSGLHKSKGKVESIPNSCPFKLELLEELHEQKLQDAQLKIELRERRKGLEAKHEFEKVSGNPKTALKETELETFFTELESVDVVIEVLEARDPEFYRCRELEDWVRGHGKRLFLSLNKSDLADPDAVSAWVTHYSPDFLCLPTSKKTAKMKDAILQRLDLSQVSSCASIAVVGYPNVGKSSLSNVLLGAKTLRVSTQPGCTKSSIVSISQTHNGVSVMDTPGITAFASSEPADDPVSCLKRVVDIDSMKDPFTPVQGLIMKLEKEILREKYGIEDFKDIQEFLGMVAKVRGLYTRPGMVDYEGTAKTVLFDWATGSIPHQAVPVT